MRQAAPAVALEAFGIFWPCKTEDCAKVLDVLARSAPNLQRLAWYKYNGPLPTDMGMVARALPQLQELSLLGTQSQLDESQKVPLQQWAAAYGHLRYLRSIRVGNEVLAAPDIANDPANMLDALPTSEPSVSGQDEEKASRMNAFAKLVANHCPELQEVLFCHAADGRTCKEYVRIPGRRPGVHLDQFWQHNVMWL